MQYLSAIKTLKSQNEFRFKEKGSEFIAFAAPAETVEEAERILEGKRKQFYDATHNCYAYKIMTETEKYSDDGEPNGTAGIRIMNAIQHFELTNLIVIVTRYFGGTKLGVGPLGKAYYNSAHDVLEESKVIEKINYSQYDIIYNFEQSKTIHHFLNSYKCIIKENKFDTRPIISFLIKPENLSDFETDIKNATKGSTKINLIRNAIFVKQT